MEGAIEEWRTRSREPRILQDTMDSQLWCTIPAPGGKPNHDNRLKRASKDEPRIGITLGFDGYVSCLINFQEAPYLITYAELRVPVKQKFNIFYSEALSCLIANVSVQLENVPPHALALSSNCPVRCLRRSLLISCIFSGPESPDHQQTQCLPEIINNELIQVFDEGRWLKSRTVTLLTQCFTSHSNSPEPWVASSETKMT